MNLRSAFLLLTLVPMLIGCSEGESSSSPVATMDPVSLAIFEGNVAACKDGGFSDNTDFGGTCSSAGGVDEWLAPFGECADGTVIKMSEDASCRDDDFKGLLPADFVPTPTADDVARCKNGLFSDNTDFGGTCSSAGGVDEWLAPFGECADGTVIKMSEDASCADDDFKGLLPADFVPAATADDVARCKNGLFSDNTDFGGTCSSAGGVDEWLAPFGECADGTVIKMSEDASCPDDDFKGLLPADYVPVTTTAPPPTTPPVTIPPVTSPPLPVETPSQRNARQMAEDYLDYMPFSRSGLIDQLKYEGFDESDATYGVDALGTDWFAQAARMAAQYLEYSSFSRRGLIDQLLYEGFTQEEAEYGVSTTGL